MMQAMYASASSESESLETTMQMMDFHRFYRAVLNGPENSGRIPKFRITYAVPKAGK